MNRPPRLADADLVAFMDYAIVGTPISPEALARVNYHLDNYWELR